MVEVGTAAGLLVVGMEVVKGVGMEVVKGVGMEVVKGVGTAAGTAEIIRQLSLYRLSAASQLGGDFTQWQEHPINLQKGADGVWVHFMVGGGLVEVKM